MKHRIVIGVGKYISTLKSREKKYSLTGESRRVRDSQESQVEIRKEEMRFCQKIQAKSRRVRRGKVDGSAQSCWQSGNKNKTKSKADMRKEEMHVCQEGQGESGKSRIVRGVKMKSGKKKHALSADSRRVRDNQESQADIRREGTCFVRRVKDPK